MEAREREIMHAHHHPHHSHRSKSSVEASVEQHFAMSMELAKKVRIKTLAGYSFPSREKFADFFYFLDSNSLSAFHLSPSVTWQDKDCRKMFAFFSRDETNNWLDVNVIWRKKELVT